MNELSLNNLIIVEYVRLASCVVDLHSGEEVLLEFVEQLSEKGESDEKKEALCLDFSNKWFTLLHSTRPFIIHDVQQLADLVSCNLILNYPFLIFGLSI